MGSLLQWLIIPGIQALRSMIRRVSHFPEVLTKLKERFRINAVITQVSHSGNK